ncbi:hypothetical protein LTR56_025472 [Elasticomyces elasticus]|nr:hypothetical protein LTR56_025472 [Elasticomyces elasticus]KAK3627188.1 hypothetical protein LTR22_022870 [Elasticomyces elasticus]KAK4907456.1 hypothetical protein LTR49_023520 [Elasticomyces elasticus]
MRLDPNAASKFGDSTVDIAEPSLHTAIAESYQGPYGILRKPCPRWTSIAARRPYQSRRTHELFATDLLKQSNFNETYWRIVTDSSDEGKAKQLCINYSPKLHFAAQGRTLHGLIRAGEVWNVDYTVSGRRYLVDFSPVRKIVPGHSSSFPSSHVQPGSMEDEFYSPPIQLANGCGEVWNAPIIASDVTEECLNQFCDGIPPEMLEDFRSKLHDQALSICPRKQTVTLATTYVSSFGKSVLHLGCDPVPATLDGGICSSRLDVIPTSNDDVLFSGVEWVFVYTNGHTNADLPPAALNNEISSPMATSRSAGEHSVVD